MRFLTNLADQAVMLPLLAATTLMLALLGWWRGAAAWLVAAGGTLAVMLALKLLFLACHGVLPAADIRTPSGHTAAAAVVAGGLAVLFAGRVSARAALALLVAASAAIVIGFSRLALSAHNLPEVIAGGVVGVTGALAFALLAGPVPERLPVGRMAAVLVGITVLFHGFQLPAEAAIVRFASLLHTWPLSACEAPGRG